MMDKKWIFAMGIALCCQLSMAETCPTIDEIKHKTLTEWKAFDSDDGSPLPPKRVAQFKAHAEQFALAEWAQGTNQKGAVHCYYRDKNGSDLEAYLAKDNYRLKNSKNYWYEVSGFMHCAAGMTECEFENSGAPHTELAKK